MFKKLECKNDHDGSCEIFKSMKDDYKFTDENFKHCEEFLHSKMRTIACKYGQECRSFQRLVAGGYRLDDLCHMKIFIHPARNRQDEDQMFVNLLFFQ